MTSAAQKHDQDHVAAVMAAGGFGPTPTVGNIVAETPSTKVRAVKAVSILGLVPAVAAGDKPIFEWVDPRTLLVDEAYQRNLSERSMKLIRKIIGEFDWRRLKPPVCAQTPAGLEVLDGQHTAIAAASHPGVELIPVMVVEAVTRQDRAKAFIGHNRDRLGITAMQLHFAAVAGGDEDAQTIDLVCERAGITVLKSTPPNGVFKPRTTLAVAAIGSLINKRGPIKARQVLQVLADADRGPINAGLIKAVDLLLHDAEFVGEIDGTDVTTALIALAGNLEREASVFAATRNVPLWRAMAVALFRKGKRRARRSAD